MLLYIFTLCIAINAQQFDNEVGLIADGFFSELFTTHAYAGDIYFCAKDNGAKEKDVIESAYAHIKKNDVDGFVQGFNIFSEQLTNMVNLIEANSTCSARIPSAYLDMAKNILKVWVVKDSDVKFDKGAKSLVINGAENIYDDVQLALKHYDEAGDSPLDFAESGADLARALVGSDPDTENPDDLEKNII